MRRRPRPGPDARAATRIPELSAMAAILPPTGVPLPTATRPRPVRLRRCPTPARASVAGARNAGAMDDAQAGSTPTTHPTTGAPDAEDPGRPGPSGLGERAPGDALPLRGRIAAQRRRGSGHGAQRAAGPRPDAHPGLPHRDLRREARRPAGPGCRVPPGRDRGRGRRDRRGLVRQRRELRARGAEDPRDRPADALRAGPGPRARRWPTRCCSTRATSRARRC